MRRAIMGDANRQATPEEITRMQALVAKAMQDGAVGFSTGLTYIPGTYSSTAEVIALAKEAARFHGVYASHMRNEGERAVDAINEALAVGRAAHMPVEISHFKIDNKLIWGDSVKTLALVEQYRKEGVDVLGRSVSLRPGPAPRSRRWSLPALLPTAPKPFAERLSSPRDPRQNRSPPCAKAMPRARHDGYSYAMVASCRQNHSIEGKTISEINLAQGGKPGVDGEIQVILDLLARDPTGTSTA